MLDPAREDPDDEEEALGPSRAAALVLPPESALDKNFRP